MEQASRPDFTNPLLTGSSFGPVPQPAGDRHWMKRVRCLCLGGSSPAASVDKGGSMWGCRQGSLARGDLSAGACWCWRNISPPPTCCQKVLDQRGERKCILCWYSHGGGYMNLSGLLLSRAFLMWLRPTPLAPGKREMDTGAGLTAAWREMLGPLYSTGSNKKCRSWPEPCPRCAFWAGLWCPPALAEAVCALGMLISSPSWRQDCCLQSNQPGWTGPCPWNPPPSAQSPHRVGVLALMQLQSCF